VSLDWKFTAEMQSTPRMRRDLSLIWMILEIFQRLTMENVYKRREQFMEKFLCLLCGLAMISVSCGVGDRRNELSANRPQETGTPCKEVTIDKETAIRIAKGDAVDNYKVSIYDIIAEEQSDGWRIVFKLTDPGLRGGGPDYLVDKKTGKILNATYNK
jgi:hypothetical protein